MTTRTIYLDHNATTPLDPRVLEAMAPFLTQVWGNPSSPYALGREARAAVEQARANVVEALGAGTGSIVFTAGGTESDNLAIRGVARALRDRGRHIVASSIEHHAVLNTFRALEAEGWRVSWLPVGSGGAVDPGDIERSLESDTVLVSVMHANNETGVIQPVEEIAAIARRRGVAFHTDAVQTLGKIPLRVDDLGADLVSISGHKVYGPKGTGALWVRKGTPILPATTGGSHELGLRAGTENVSGIVGLAEAVALACGSETRTESRRVEALRDLLESAVRSRIPDSWVNGGGARRVPNTSNLGFRFVDGEAVLLGLELQGICASTGSACATGEPEPSHVLRAMGLAPREAQGSIRLSLGKGNLADDIERTVEALARTVERLRNISSASDREGSWLVR